MGAHVGTGSFDLDSLAILAATIQHLMHGEALTMVYDVLTTLELPVTGRRSQEELGEITDAFMMLYAFGLNLDVSMVEDVRKAKAYLEKSHSGWSRLRDYARGVAQRVSLGKDLDFDQIAQV